MRSAFFIAMRVLVCLLLLAPLGALAQSADSTGQIVGRVVDKETGEGLPGANVLLVGMTLGAAADIDGYYLIEDIPPGDYTVEVFYAGYEAREIENVVISQGLVGRLDVKLEDLFHGVCISFCDWLRPIVSRDPFASRVIPAEQYYGPCCMVPVISMDTLPITR